MWQVVPELSFKRKCPAVPALLALVSCHVPDFDFVPAEAFAIQSDGSVIDASSVPLSAAPQFAGGEPERISRIGPVPTAVSNASNRAFLTVVENWIAMGEDLNTRRLSLRLASASNDPGGLERGIARAATAPQTVGMFAFMLLCFAVFMLSVVFAVGVEKARPGGWIAALLVIGAVAAYLAHK